MHKHLKRIPVLLPLDRAVIYFVTCCTANRQKVLADSVVHHALRHAWEQLGNWQVGRYVIMPDHVHFFVSPQNRDDDLSGYMRAFRALVTRQLRPLNYPYPLWQREFFDHLLRSDESYGSKWEYVYLNPVRHGLVTEPEQWPYAGEIHALDL